MVPGPRTLPAQGARAWRVSVAGHVEHGKVAIQSGNQAQWEICPLNKQGSNLTLGLHDWGGSGLVTVEESRALRLRPRNHRVGRANSGSHGAAGLLGARLRARQGSGSRMIRLESAAFCQ